MADEQDDEKKKKSRKQQILDFVNSMTPQGMALTPPTAGMQTATELTKKRKKEQGK